MTLEELEQAGHVIVESKKTSARLESSRTMLEERWESRGVLGLAALRQLWSDEGPWLNRVIALPWPAIVSRAATNGMKALCREVEEKAIGCRRELSALINQAELFPARIAALSVADEAPNRVPGTAAWLVQQITGPETASELRQRIENLKPELARITVVPLVALFSEPARSPEPEDFHDSDSAA